MEDIELLGFKLNEYKESLKEELSNLSRNTEREELQKKLAELHKEIDEVKTRIKEVRQSPKENRGRILEIARKLKAIKQLI